MLSDIAMPIMITLVHQQRARLGLAAASAGGTAATG